jgi:polysaccharide export outer membrane protein
MAMAAAGPVTLPADVQVTVRRDGTISVPYAGQVMAAGLTPAELDAAIARALSDTPVQQTPAVRILQLVSVQVALEGSADGFHVFGEVTTKGRKIVQTFEEAVQGSPGQQSVAKAIPLVAGSYRLTVVVRNLTTGAVRNSELDFTVD